MANVELLGQHLKLLKPVVDDAVQDSNELLISAHGVYWSRPTKENWYTIPSNPHGYVAGPTLRFYAPHGYSMLDMDHGGFGSFIGKERYTQYEEKNPGDQVRNYRLSKYESSDKKERGGVTVSQAGFELDYSAGLADGKILHLLSIRNRWQSPGAKAYQLQLGISLGEVIDILNAHQKYYAVIHCSFCRITTMNALISMLPRQNNKYDWDPNKNINNNNNNNNNDIW